MPISKTQIDRLGDRLKDGALTESDLRLLDDYRRSFGEAYEAVVQTITRRGQFPTGRLAKSTLSIVEKLRRESIRLSQIQDIAGCRVVVPNILDQESLVSDLAIDFPDASVTDRRDKPSHGYRAIHVIVEILQKPIEVQVRTSLQHQWAEVSEKSADVLDPTIKYGGGSHSWKRFLAATSASIARFENLEKTYSEGMLVHEIMEVGLRTIKELGEFIGNSPEEMQADLDSSKRWIEKLSADLVQLRKETASFLDEAVSMLDELKRTKQ